MATTRVSHVLGFFLWISLLIFVSKGLFGNFSSKSINYFPPPVITLPPFSYRPGRRALAVKTFDFTPFLKDSGRSNHWKDLPPGGSEIDPRYGVEKRLVPSGPNPLHH
ncbi:hypothetical protein ISN45_Aa02g022090 [Arabidopsis thaliana x Arabidopsis arenosa]|uniref:CLAVATA3/ESR (CLE)-related protein 13 n=1 Tax=Arabidopsis thaliana x Arabidopsis arenosa TaxID=1240361 RepID=A0A8T2BLU0_9BRAS|nr:hypothetical protein ISN45_Aa02g022090 [Arabidopsis thaliana x Arabidopsis arenosa]